MPAIRRVEIVTDKRPGREREQLAVARGNGGTKKANPEREVLDDGTRGGHADAEYAPHGNFEKREGDHRQQGQRSQGVLEARQRS